MKQTPQNITDALFKLDGLAGCAHLDHASREACAVGYRAIAALKRHLDLDGKLTHDEFIDTAERDLYEIQEQRSK